eukprot:c12306_g1_i1.p1 GENE.c12306_g1_i1~~c12306_g1_i1.p1  ORF type:complete len:465 (-),score=132.98 c12306_g1_i1:72-1424(-)
MRLSCQCNNVSLHLNSPLPRPRLIKPTDDIGWFIQYGVVSVIETTPAVGISLKFEDLMKYIVVKEGLGWEIAQCGNCSDYCFAKPVSGTGKIVINLDLESRDDVLRERESQPEYSPAFKLLMYNHESGPRTSSNFKSEESALLHRAQQLEAEYLEAEAVLVHQRIAQFIAEQQEELERKRQKVLQQRAQLLSLAVSIKASRAEPVVIYEEPAPSTSSTPPTTTTSNTPTSTSPNTANNNNTSAPKPDAQSSSPSSLQVFAVPAKETAFVVSPSPPAAQVSRPRAIASIRSPVPRWDPTPTSPRKNSTETSSLDEIFFLEEDNLNDDQNRPTKRDDNSNNTSSNKDDNSDNKNDDDDYDDDDDFGDLSSAVLGRRLDFNPPPSDDMMGRSMPINIPNHEVMAFRRLERPASLSSNDDDNIIVPPHTLAEKSRLEEADHSHTVPYQRRFSAL